MTTEPRTEAGLFLSNGLEAMGFSEADAYEAIAAIEAEAARLAMEDVAERVRGLPVSHTYLLDPNKVGSIRAAEALDRAAVLALLSKEEGS